MGLINSLGFLTILPMGRWAGKRQAAEGLVFFPMAGIIIGGILLAVYTAVSSIFGDSLITAVLVIISSIIITGGMHLDGLADTCDAMFSGRDKDKMLSIMRDPHIGTMGVLGIVCVLFLKVSLLSFINKGCISRTLIMMCVLSRYALIFLIFFFPYARDNGKAKIFKDSIKPRDFITATLFSVVLSAVVLKVCGILIFGLTISSVFLLGKYFAHRIGGFTGDILGAVNEAVELGVLFYFVIA